MKWEQEPRRIVRSGQMLSPLGLGCAPLGNLYHALSDEQALATVQAAWDAGVRYFDVAPFYGYTLAEHRLGQALRGKERSSYCLSTKVGRLMRPFSFDKNARRASVQGDVWVQPLPFTPEYDYSAAGVRRSIEDSLQRLGLTHIDIALVHDIGSVTHGNEQAHYWQQLTKGGGFRVLEAMRDEGVIGAIGLGVNEWEVMLQALELIDLDCSLLAGRYTLLEQGALEPLNLALKRQMAIIIGGPFNSGILASGVPPGNRAVPTSTTFNYATASAAIVARVQALQQACLAFEVPLAAAALQFVLAHPAVVSCVPGARTAQELVQICSWLQHPIPTALWLSLQQQGLLDPSSPWPAA